MKATQVYAEVTMRPIGPKILEWISELAGTFGDDTVADTIREIGATDCPPDKIMGKVRDRLAKGRATHAASRAPTAMTGRQFLACIRGEAEWPDFPITYDVRDLTQDEYTEVVNHAVEQRKRGWSGAR